MWPNEADDRELLMVSQFSGGAHCCFFLDIVDIPDGFRLVYRGRVSEMTTIEDLNGDG